MMDQPEEAAVVKEKAALEDQRTSRITSQSPVPDFHQETHNCLRRGWSIGRMLDFKEEPPSPINTEKIQKTHDGSWIESLQNRLYRLVLICLLLLSLFIIWLRYFHSSSSGFPTSTRHHLASLLPLFIIWLPYFHSSSSGFPTSTRHHLASLLSLFIIWLPSLTGKLIILLLKDELLAPSTGVSN